MQITSINIITPSKPNLKPAENIITDYSDILNFYQAQYILDGFHLQVGEMGSKQGWILHLSVIRAQIPNLLFEIIPILIQMKTPFKIVKDIQAARSLLDGYLGYVQIGKIISIYPENNKIALDLAKILINISKPYSGPAVLTDAFLGGKVYTTYGHFNNELIQYEYHIPFRMPRGIYWPFGEIGESAITKPSNLFKNKYKPVVMIKPDAKGRVIKGLYFKGMLNLKYCLIKEGLIHMWSDDQQRDIQNRLRWQYHVHRQLISVIPVPRVVDLFKENENIYFVTEFINGKCLDIAISTFYKNDSWLTMGSNLKLILLGYLLQIVDIIEKMHKKGYIHRDLTPVNFIVSRNEQIYLIDLELSYSQRLRYPSPPFDLGTTGFISPEQASIQIPTVKEDIFGLGGLMIVLFTGQSPLNFDYSSPIEMKDSLNQRIENESIAELIVRCLSSSPEGRPELKIIKDTIKQYCISIQSGHKTINA